MTEARQTVTVGSREGLHARPAKLFAKAAQECGLSVKVSKPGETAVDAASLLSVISLGVSQGESVVLSAEGDGAEATLAELAQILAADHDE